jgi:hypothetical protein
VGLGRARAVREHANLDAIFKQREWSEAALGTFALEGLMPGKDQRRGAYPFYVRAFGVASPGLHEFTIR